MFFKRYFILIIFFIIVIIYFALFFTTQNYLLPRLVKSIGIKEFKEIKLSPFFNQVVLLEGKGDFLNLGKAEIRFYPLSLFKRKFIIKKFTIEKLLIEFKEKETGGLKGDITFALPLFLKEIEIRDLVLKDLNLKREKIELRNLNVNLIGTLKNGKINSEIKELFGEIRWNKYNYNFSLSKTNLESNLEQVSITNLNLIIKNSSLYGEVIYDLKEKEWQIKIDSSFLNLKDFTDYEGEGKAKGSLKIKNSEYDGEVDIFFKRVKIIKEIDNLVAKLNFINHLVSYQLEGKIFGSLFKSKGKFDIRDFSYNLVSEIFNLENLLPFKIERGILEINGKELMSFNFKFDLIFNNEEISFLKGEGNYQDGKIFIKKMIGKGGKTDFSLVGEVSKEKIIITAEVIKLSLETINNLFKKEIKGIVKGKGEIIYGKKSFSVKGNWEVKDFYFKELNLSFKDFNFKGNFSLKERIDLEGEITLEELKTSSLSFDSLKFNSSFKDFQIVAILNNSVLKINGNLLRDFKDSLLLSLEKVEFLFNNDSLVNKAPITIEIKKNLFKLENFNLSYNGGELALDFGKEGNIIDLRSEIKNFALEHFLWINKRYKKFSGKANGQIFLTYDLKNKYLNNFIFNTKIINFQFAGINLDSLTGDFSLQKETIFIKELSLFKKEDRSKIYGFLIFDFTKRELLSQNLMIELNNFPSEIIFFIPQILTVKEGKINGKISLEGNFKNPNMKGKVNLIGGEIDLKIPEVKIKDVLANIIFSENEIIFYQISGRAKNGEILANGFIRFGEFFKIDTLHKDIRFVNLPITYQKDFIGLVDGNVYLSLNRENYLKIIGEGDIKEGLITIPFGIRNGEKKEPDTLLELDLTFRGERNIWLRNKNADLELAVDFNLKLKKGIFTYSGKINTKQGYLYYLGRSLQLKEGEIVFENISQFDPKISLIGFLTTKPITYQNRKERFKIILEVSGYLSKPTFNLSSEPPYLTQEEMISYLGLSFTPEELKNWEEKDIFLDILQDRILSYFERETSERLRKYIGLDYFRLESSFRGEPYLRLSVGKYLGERFYFSYTHSFIEEKQDVFRAEYYLNKNHQIIGERNEFGKTIIKYLFYFRY